MIVMIHKIPASHHSEYPYWRKAIWAWVRVATIAVHHLLITGRSHCCPGSKRFSYKVLFAILASALLTGCLIPGPKPFENSREKTKVISLNGYKTLGALPFAEAWYGMYFQDEKVGYSHFKIQRAGSNFKIMVESEMRLKSLKTINKLHTSEKVMVKPDLTLISFESRVVKNGKKLRINGRVERDEYALTMETGGERIDKTFGLDERPLLHSSAIALYPAIHGLEDGEFYSFQVFKTESLKLVKVEQQVFMVRGTPGPNNAVWRVRNQFGNATVMSWLNKEGMVVIEKAVSGNLITILEDEETAKSLPTKDSEKRDLVTDWSLIRVDKEIRAPGKITYLRLSINGLQKGSIPQDHRQEIVSAPQSSDVELVVRAEDLSLATRSVIGKMSGPRDRFLKPTYRIQSQHKEIIAQAKKIIADSKTKKEKITDLVRWTSKHIKDKPKDSLTALSTLRSKEGECEAHANLYTALARSVNIPTRLVHGLVYAEEIGFLYHAWAESYLNGWVAVDPTLGQIPADATHIKLFTGPMEDNAALLNSMVGKIKIKTLDYK